MAKTHNLPTPAQIADLKNGVDAFDYAKTLQEFKLRPPRQKFKINCNLLI
jgi:hypothetical protein